MEKIAINSKIVSYKLVDDKFDHPKVEDVKPIVKNTKRPDTLEGTTYKIKSPLTSSALYVTINDIEGEDGKKQPFEVFCYSKENNHYQWITALTRMLSAQFRKGGDLSFIVEELECIAEPGSNGYIAKGGKHIPSLVAELGQVIRKHFVKLGIIEVPEHDDHFKNYIEEKKQEYLNVTKDTIDSHTSFPSNATICPSCNTKAMVPMDNCMTCLQCGNSKCG